MAESRIGQLDFLRGIALFGVLAVHTMQAFPSALSFMDDIYYYGRYGVQLFFAVSGFTMMMMYRSYMQHWESPAKVFYIKRIMRLYPLFVVAAFAYWPLQLAPSYFNPDGTQFIDIVRVLTLTGGIDPHLLNAVVPGGWSIVNEIYFYITFPLIYYLTGRVNPYLFSLAICLMSYALAGFADELFAGKENYLVTDFLYRNYINQLIIFFAGTEAYRQVFNGKSDFLKICLPLIFAGILLEFLSHRAALLDSVVLAILSYYSLLLVFKFSKFTSQKIQSLGRVTYTGYIIHFGIIDACVWLSEIFQIRQSLYFEIVIVITTLITYVVANAIAGVTERYWQHVGNKICEKKLKVIKP